MLTLLAIRSDTAIAAAGVLLVLLVMYALRWRGDYWQRRARQAEERLELRGIAERHDGVNTQP